MTSYARRAGAKLLRTVAQALSPAAEAARALTFAKDVGDAPQLFVRSPDGTRQISGLEANLWERPVSPSIYDDEFDTTTLDPAWTATGTWTPGGINPYENFAAGDTRYALHTDYRPSWLMVQKPSGIGNATISKVIAPAGDFFIYARCSLTTRASATVGNEDAVLLTITNNPSTPAERVNISLTVPVPSNLWTVQFYRTNAGVNTQISASMNDYSTAMGMSAVEAIGLTRRGNIYDGWVFGSSGHALWMGATPAMTAITPALVELTFVNTVGTNPGNRLVGVDFFRYRDGSTFLP
jgi:hypothetical protein